MSVLTLHFTVEGMPADTDSARAIIGILKSQGIDVVQFDETRRIFSIEIDPGRISFSTIRKLVSEAGEKEGKIYLAVPMSP
jgi:hypothetical protein